MNKFKRMTLTELLHHYAVMNMVLRDYDEIPLDQRNENTDREAIEHRQEQFLCAIMAIQKIRTSGDLAKVLSLGIKQDLMKAVNSPLIENAPASELIN